MGAVLLDEFHERNLDGDLALALALDSKASGVAPDLRCARLLALAWAAAMQPVPASVCTP